MRRQDRAMPRDFADYVIDKAVCGVVTFVDAEGMPYAVPLSIARVGDRLYFHSALAGTKVDLAAASPLVQVVFVGEAAPPDFASQEELDAIGADPSRYRALADKVFTTGFESAVVRGRLHRLEDEADRIAGLRAVCEKYTPHKMQYFEQAISASLQATAVFAIDIIEVTAKCKCFDAEGNVVRPSVAAWHGVAEADA